MNAFVKKEIRLLLPNFAFACVLALAGIFFSDKPDSLLNGLTYFVGCIFCPAVAVMLALSPFGVEVGSGTFSNLLAQPVSRLKIWETKIALLGIALITLAFLWVVTFFFNATHANTKHDFNDWLDLFSVVITFGLVIFSGGLWTVLLLRQVAAAFWFTLLVPGVLLTILAALVSEHDGNFFAGMIVTVLGLYSLAGFFFARWLFLRAQDVQFAGGTIVMPQLWARNNATATAGESRQRRPRTALWRKEILLHQSQLVVAFVLFVLHLGVLVARQFVDLHKSPEAHFVLSIFWGLWLALPLLVGCAAVAEERKLGTLEGQLCLPVKRRTQFFIKLTVAFGLSVLFGAVMPLLLEGTRILPDLTPQFRSLGIGMVDLSKIDAMSPMQTKLVLALGFFSGILPLLSFIFLALVIGFVSFYVSTLARNTLQTLAPAVVGIMVAGVVVIGSFTPWNEYWEWLWQGPVGFVIGLPIVALAVLALMFWNFQNLRPDWRAAVKNFFVFIAALLLGTLATAAVYHRFWEKFTAFEPAHGAAKLSLADGAQLNVWWAETNVRLPDGRIWTARFGADDSVRSPLARLAGKLSATLVGAQFYRGSNWMSLTRYGRELIGIKTDGTLWMSEAPMSAADRQTIGAKAAEEKMRNLVQFGVETNWCSVRQTYLSALLVKTDGTMWRLGTNKFDEKHNEWPGLRAFTPYRLGTDSGWAKATEDYYQFTVQKTNGSI